MLGSDIGYIYWQYINWKNINWKFKIILKIENNRLFKLRVEIIFYLGC